MPQIEVVENPRRKRRRHYTAKQLAAGFGGKRYRNRRHYRRHHNPALATLAANPRRRRHHYYNPRRRRSYRRHRNPLFGGTKGMFDIGGALFIGGGILAAKVSPKLIQKVWAAAPTTGIGGYAVKIGGAFLIAQGVRMVTRSAHNAHYIMIGALGSVLYDIANDYLLPTIGLSGLGDDSSYVTAGELRAMGLSTYMPSRPVISGIGAYNPTADISVMSA